MKIIDMFLFSSCTGKTINMLPFSIIYCIMTTRIFLSIFCFTFTSQAKARIQAVTSGLTEAISQRDIAALLAAIVAAQASDFDGDLLIDAQKLLSLLQAQEEVPC